MSYPLARRLMIAIFVIGLAQFFGMGAARAQSCAALADARVALVCRGYEQAERQISTSCRAPANIAPDQAASYCAQLLAQARAKRAALFPVQSRSTTARPVRATGTDLLPLPVTSAPAKPAVLRGFYIGMTINEALAAAAVALAPWPAVYLDNGYGSIRVMLKRGPRDVFSIDECVNLPLQWGGKPDNEFICAASNKVLQFVFDVDTKNGTIKEVAISSNYVLGSHGYNLQQSQLSFDDFGKLIGKRLGAPVRFGKADNPTTNCSSSGGDYFHSGVTTCKTDKNESRWYDIDNVAACKCSMTIYEPGRIYLVPAKTPKPEAIR